MRNAGLDAYETHSSRHVNLALLAMVLSFIVHMVMMYMVADLRLDRTRVPALRQTAAQLRPPVRVERVPRDPLLAIGNPETGDPEAGAGVGFPRDRVGELARLPDPALLAPPSLSAEALAGTLVNLQAPARQPTAFAWQPRQQILAVMDRTVVDAAATLPRRDIPLIERVPRAPDYVPPVDVTRDRFGNDSQLVPDADRDMAEGHATAAVDRRPVAPQLPAEADPDAATSRFGENPGEVSEFAAIDNRLVARMQVYREPGPEGRAYFRVTVDRRGTEVLPVVPKDVLFVQDTSRSLAEERLYFCRQAFTDALAWLGPRDRFNVIGFSDQARYCFEEWADPTADATNRAAAFISGFRADGETDVFRSMQSLTSVVATPGRPLIAIAVTDGRPTAGTTASTAIIGEFTRGNTNGLSVFLLGTHGRANGYLLDMLAYCNGGSSVIVRSGRWDIADGIRGLVNSVSRPVLGGLSVAVDAASGADVLPLAPGNLYADRPLELFGACPGSTREVVVQVRGQGGEARCDVIFRFDLSRNLSNDASIRDRWARQKMYGLIGTYARQPSDSLLAEMYRLSRQYNLPIPYQKEL